MMVPWMYIMLHKTNLKVFLIFIFNIYFHFSTLLFRVHHLSNPYPKFILHRRLLSINSFSFLSRNFSLRNPNNFITTKIRISIYYCTLNTYFTYSVFKVKQFNLRQSNIHFFWWAKIRRVWAGLSRSLSSFCRCSIFKHGPILLLTKDIISCFVRVKNFIPSIFCSAKLWTWFEHSLTCKI